MASRYSENPDGSARNALRYQKKIADTMTRAKEGADRMLALRQLAKGVPTSVLPSDGIHDRMSPQDIQAATDRINQWRATNQQGAPAPSQAAGTAGTGSAIADGLMGRKPYQPSQPAQQGPETRQAQGGGMEQLVQIQSGPRWVAYVPNAPARQGPDQSTGPTMVQRQVQNPRPITDSIGNRTTDAANLAQNRALYQPGGIPAPVPRAYQGPSVETPSQADAMRIAKQYGPEDVNSIPQRSVAGVSPAGARNDINTGGNLPTVPQTAAIQGPPMPAVPPSSPPPVVSDTAPPGYVAGQAVRNAPNVAAQVGQAATGQAQNIARNVVDSVVKPVRGFVSGLTGSKASPPVSPMAPVASRASQSIDLANRVADSITQPKEVIPGLADARKKRKPYEVQ